VKSAAAGDAGAMLFRPILLAAALLLAAGARAEDKPAKDEELSLFGYGTAHVACVEWTDGCSVCRRMMSVKCSTPGIACQPQAIICKAP
jgi:hypothetical protein